jgi:hypothetical protein
VLAVPVFALLQLPRKSKTQKYGVATIVGLGVISVIVSFYRLLDAKIGGYMEDKPLPLGKRNVHIVGTMVMVVPVLVAFSLPNLRIFFRGKKKEAGYTNYEARSGDREGRSRLGEAQDAEQDSYINLVPEHLKGNALVMEQRTAG